MNVVVGYASRHGATRQIAERIAETLRTAGLDVQVGPVGSVDLAAGEAFVIGSAAYFGHWLKEATEFVQRHREVLAGHPVWLFSSGPLGDEATDAHGQDLRTSAEPKELAELREAVHLRDHRVFFGVLDPNSLRIRERMVRALPAGRQLLPEGDFRDWADIETWAEGIASDLTRGSSGSERPHDHTEGGPGNENPAAP
jgi:menaquinone-dependent protoporphyrinogen oxidase